MIKNSKYFYLPINPLKPYNAFWSILWNIAEKFHISLGSIGPWVFGEAIGVQGKRVK